MLVFLGGYLFPREVMTVERITDMSQIEHLDEDDLLMTYEIRKTWRNMTYMEGIDWDWSAVQYFTICILADGSLYCFNTYDSINNCLQNDFPYQVESVYYLGNLSADSLWNLRYLMFMVNQDSEKETTYSDMWNTDEPCENKYLAQNEDYFDEETDTYIYEMKEVENECCLYFSNNNIFKITKNEYGERYSVTTDQHALEILDWLRSTWYFEQYIDLMYQELYPWLVEE